MRKITHEHSIDTRRIRFGIHYDLPKYWNQNCPVKTHMFNAVAMLAPAFERLAITSVLPYQNQITDDVLKQQVEGFIGQESAHGSEFIRMQCVLKKQGYDPRQVEKKNVKRFVALSSNLSPEIHLSFTLAAEHVTAIISDLLLTDKQWLENAEPKVAALWRWHAIEEIDHKAVVFDLYESLGLGYWMRIKGMLRMTLVLNIFLMANYCHLAKKDGLLCKPSFWFKTLWVLWGKPGFVRKQFWAYLSYFSPKFHPWKKDNHNLTIAFKQAFSQDKNLNVTEFLNKI